MATTIVGIGASAGGVRALADFFGAMPAETGLAFVIIQHFSYARQSMMVEILSAYSAMSVLEVLSGDTPKPNTIYVPPPGTRVTFDGRNLVLVDSKADDHLHQPIDLFFKSMAANLGNLSYGVVLSGTSTDGTLGVQAIKKAGGVTLAQSADSADSAEFSAMPISAVNSGFIDFSLKPTEMPRKILELEAWHKQQSAMTIDTIRKDIEAQLAEILDLVDDDRRNRFHAYKPGTLSRRILRRMMMRHVVDVREYIGYLRTSKCERQALTRDFLIGVTEFFRNPEMFQMVETMVLPAILQKEKDEFRIWCPGCSTGEEVFSLAILISDLQEKTGDQRPWKLFGTDIDPEALEIARRGVFNQAAITSLADHQIKSYFENDHGRLTITSSLRNMCVFARHNVLADPPFSRLDLIVCRNLMIYVDASAQADMVSRFHYALNRGGFLWLGPSESLSSNAHRFETIDRYARIFKRDETAASISVPFLHPDYNNRMPSFRSEQSNTIMTRKNHESTDLEHETEQAFLSSFAPPFIRISLHDEVLYASEAARQFLRPSKGTPNPVFEFYVIEPLRMPLRMILKQVRHNKEEVVLKNMAIKIDGETKSFDLYARPLDQELKSVLIAFQPVRWNGDITTINAETFTTEAAYEAELATVRKRLLSREREFKMTEQEFWASNEELLTINEELQSSNEELQSSQEELRSVNADLELANTKLSEKNSIISTSNNNFKNLIESVDLAIMFIDQKGLLRLFTPRSKDLFSL